MLLKQWSHLYNVQKLTQNVIAYITHIISTHTTHIHIMHSSSQRPPMYTIIILFQDNMDNTYYLYNMRPNCAFILQTHHS